MAAAEGIIIPAETVGKYKVGAQITAVLSLLLDYYLDKEWMRNLGWIALWIAMILAVYSAFQYFQCLLEQTEPLACHFPDPYGEL